MYQAGQQYMPHWDPLSGDEGKDRLTTIFAILADSCDGEHDRCGTQFPGILIDWTAEDSRWNRKDDVSVHPKPIYAGEPILESVKIGLNIWTDEGKKEIESVEKVQSSCSSIGLAWE
ncbi:2OG-Fe(II)oxygenase [Diaporthe amygdali]|uniref:2OG-Fe(II)oxygenase n=1 Tax=Phomopsis amygdali TaxID=1214568 RepID=UPI0022FE3BB6|nr:2OG-Fe(II)oxygenase [Diaporthe amygdali]KAJ0107093.1 2OG-Fe(II)oxygenase [Diaporthe amygdali]